jgi:hypothetical protein
MSRDTTSRDVKLNALALLTGGITAATFLGTGLVTGLAADYTAQKTQAKAESKAATLRGFPHLCPSEQWLTPGSCKLQPQSPPPKAR